MITTATAPSPQAATAQEVFYKTIDPAEFAGALASDPKAVLIDVRTPEEFAAGHISGAMNLNWQDRDTFDREALALPKSKTLYLYCKGGSRSAQAATWLTRQGYHVVSLHGGYMAWKLWRGKF